MIRNKFFPSKIISSLLAFIILATAVTGCGESKNAGNNSSNSLNPEVSTVLSDAQKMSKDYVFKQTDYPDILKKGEDVLYLDYVGDKVRAVAMDKHCNYRYISLNTDGSDAQSFDLPIDGKNVPQPVCASDKDGNIYIHYGAKESYLIKYDTSGNELLSKTMDFSINEMYWTEKYGLVLNTTRGIETYNDQDDFSVVIDIKDIQKTLGEDNLSLYKGSNDQIFLSSGGFDTNPKLTKVDIDNKTLGKISTTCSEKNYSFFGGSGYDLYAGFLDEVFGYDYESDKLTKILDKDDSDIDAMALLDWIVISDTELFATTQDDNSNTLFSTYTKVDPSDVPDKTLITIGGAWFTYDVEQAAKVFNKSNDKYKVKVIDYSYSYDDSDELADVIQAFNQDILSGNTPDILCFSNYFAPNIESYANKGVLLDLSSAFDKGGALEDLDILPNIYEMMKTNDKVYSVIPSFTYETLLMKESAVNGKNSISLKEFDALNAKGIMDGYRFIDTCIQSAGNKFIDWQNHTCNLNCPEFVEILDCAKKVNDPKKSADTADIENDDDIADLFASNNGVVCDGTLYGFSAFTDIEQNTFKEKVAIMGFPNNNGETNTMITPYNQLCVSSTTKCPEGALEFIKCYCTNPSINGGSLFPSDKAFFETYMKEATEPAASEDDAVKYTNGHEVKLDPLPADEAQKLYDSILSCKSMHRPDSQLEVILNEETPALFSGQKSAEEVADIIHNRVSTYLNEQ